MVFIFASYLDSQDLYYCSDNTSYHPAVHAYLVKTPLYGFVYLLSTGIRNSSHIYVSDHNVTSSPADDVIHIRGHTCPEAVVAWVARLQLSGCLLTYAALVKPPKLPSAEQIGLAIVSPDKGCIHPVHWLPALFRHAPFREGPRVTAHGLCVLENPILRSWIGGGKCETDINN